MPALPEIHAAPEAAHAREIPFGAGTRMTLRLRRDHPHVAARPRSAWLRRIVIFVTIPLTLRRGIPGVAASGPKDDGALSGCLAKRQRIPAAVTPERFNTYAAARARLLPPFLFLQKPAVAADRNLFHSMKAGFSGRSQAVMCP